MNTTMQQEPEARPARKEAEHAFHVFRLDGEGWTQLTGPPISVKGRGEQVRREAIARAIAQNGESENGTGKFMVIKDGEGLTFHDRKVKVVPQQEVEEWS